MKDNYKNRARKETPLPDDFQWEHLNEGIFDIIEVEKKKQGGLLANLPLRKILIVITILPVLSSILFYHYYRTLDHSVVDMPFIFIQNNESDANSIICSNLPSYDPAKTIKEQASLDKNTRIESSTDNYFNVQSSSLMDSEQTLIPKEETRVVAERSKTISASLDKMKAIKTIEPTFFLEASSIPYLEVSKEEIAPSPQIDNPKKKDEDKPAKFAIQLSGGVGLWSTKHFRSFSENTSYEASETTLETRTTALLLSHYLSPHISITTGISYQELHSRFRYEQSISEEEPVNALVSMKVNSFLRDSTFVYKDTSLTTTTSHRVQHYNTHKILSIPVKIGYDFDLNPTNRIGVYIGGIYSLKLGSDGRSLLNDQITTYNKDMPLHKKNYGIACLFGVKLERTLQHDFYISAAMQHTQWVQNWSQELNVKLKPRTTKFSFGIGKRF